MLVQENYPSRPAPPPGLPRILPWAARRGSGPVMPPSMGER